MYQNRWMRKYVVLYSDFFRGIALFCIILSFFENHSYKEITRCDKSQNVPLWLLDVSGSPCTENEQDKF